MLRSEILANRQKVITFLKQPKRLKASGKLDKGNGQRCCLGHMCYALGIPRTTHKTNNEYSYGVEQNSGYAPKELLNVVGLYSEAGRSGNNNCLKSPHLPTAKYESLALLNDCTTITPQKIGEYLESVIEGGSGTPWKPLSDYPESL